MTIYADLPVLWHGSSYYSESWIIGHRNGNIKIRIDNEIYVHRLITLVKYTVELMCKHVAMLKPHDL